MDSTPLDAGTARWLLDILIPGLLAIGVVWARTITIRLHRYEIRSTDTAVALSAQVTAQTIMASRLDRIEAKLDRVIDHLPMRTMSTGT